MSTMNVWRSPVWELLANSFEPTGAVNTRSGEVEEKETHFLLSFDLPGFAKDEVQIEVAGDELLIEGRNPVRGNFRRAITIPNTVDFSKIEAEHANGVLRIALPKAESARPRKIPITLGAEGPASSGGFFSRLLGKDDREKAPRAEGSAG